MTGILVVLAVLSAIGGFFSIPHFLEHQMPLPAVDEHLHHLETPLIVASVVIALAGLAGAAWFYGGDASRAARMGERFSGLHRLLSGKYYVDELYEAVIGRPLTWVSDRIFLRIGDRAIIDGTLHGLTGIARQAAGLLGRVQTGNLHLYAWLVLAGIFALLLWSWRHV
jgi:NADH-quinone oxidoreductase subunit L